MANSNIIIIIIFFLLRQFHQHPGEARLFPSAETGSVPAAHCGERRRKSAHEQHQHAEHPSVRLQ